MPMKGAQCWNSGRCGLASLFLAKMNAVLANKGGPSSVCITDLITLFIESGLSRPTNRRRSHLLERR